MTPRDERPARAMGAPLPVRLVLALLSLALWSHARELRVEALRAESYGDVVDVLLRVQIPDGAGLQVYIAPDELTVDEATAPKFRVERLFTRRDRDSLYADIRRLPAGVGVTPCQLVVKATHGKSVIASTHIPRLLEPPPEEVDVALLIDESLSMRRTDKEKLRLEAAKIFVDLARRSTRIARIAIVAFDHRARTLVPPTQPTESGKLYQAIERIRASGQTDMDGALYLARKVLEQSPTQAKALVLLTDGKDAPGRYENAHAPLIKLRWPVYTVGLSDRADAEVLRRIAVETGGEYHQAPTNAELQDVFGKICLALQRKTRIRSRMLALRPGVATTDPILIDDTISAATISLKAPHPEIGYALATPDAKTVAPSPGAGVSYGRKTAYQYYDLWTPVPGKWTARLDSARAATVTVDTTAVTPLLLRPFPLRSAYYRGEPVEIAASLAVHDFLLPGAKVEAFVSTANGRTTRVPLHDDGRHNDTAPGDGVFAGLFPGNDQAGLCTIRIVAAGETPKGVPFEREASVAALIDAQGHSRLWCSTRALDLGTVYTGETGTRSFELKLTSAVAGSAAEPVRVTLQAPSDRSGSAVPETACQLSPANIQLGGAKLLPVSMSVTPPPDAPEGSYRGKLTLESKYDSVELPVLLEVRHPRLVVPAQQLDFGRIESGGEAVASLTARLEPRGALPARMCAADTQLTATPAETSIGAAPVPVEVTFRAPADHLTGPFRSTFTVQTPLGAHTVPVVCQVVRPSLSVTPEAVDFGEASPGQAVERSLSLALEGVDKREATLSAKPLAGPAGPLPFDVQETVSLTPSQTAQATLALRVPPTHPPGVYRTTLTVSSPLGRHDVPCSVRVVPVNTFRIVPTLDFTRVAIGTATDMEVEIQSLADAEQRLTLALPIPSDHWALSVEPREVTLPAKGSARLTFRLAIPERAKPGTCDGVVTVSGPSRGSKVAVRAERFRPPHQSLAFEPPRLDVGRLPAGAMEQVQIRVRSLVDESQPVAVEPGSLNISPTEFTLPAGGSVPLTITFPPGAGDETPLAAEVVARGRSLPATLPVEGVVFAVPGRTFDVSPFMLDLGTVQAGSGASGTIELYSLWHKEQKLSFAPLPESASFTVEHVPGLFVPPFGIEAADIRVRVASQAPLGERVLRLEVRGPGEPVSFDVRLDVVLPPPPEAPSAIATVDAGDTGWGEGLTIFVLLALLLLVLILGFLLARWLVRHNRMPRMAKYFAMSALVHALILFTALDLIIAHKVQKKEIGPLFRVGLKELAGGAFSSQGSSVADALDARRELARRLEAERSQRETSRLARIMQKTQRQQLSASQANLDRPKSQEELELTQPPAQAKQLSLDELQTLVEQFREAERTREDTQPDARHAAETDPEHLARVRSMTREQVNALVEDAARPRDAQADRPPIEPDDPELSTAPDTQKRAVELETVLPALDSLAEELSRAAETAAADAGPRSTDVGATRADMAAASQRATGSGSRTAIASPRSGPAPARPGAPSPPTVLTAPGSARSRQAPAVSMDLPEEELDLAGTPGAGKPAPAAGSGGPRAATMQAERAGGASAPGSTERAVGSAASAPVAPRQADLGRPAGGSPALPSPLASSEHPSSERRAPAIGIEAPEETPVTDPLIQLPGGASKGAPAAEPRPITVQHGMPAGGAPAPARGTAPAGGRSRTSPRDTTPAASPREGGSPLFASLPRTADPSSTRQTSGITLGPISESPTVPEPIVQPADPGAGAAALAARGIRSAPAASSPSAGTARAAAAVERAGLGTPRAADVAAGRPGASATVPEPVAPSASKAQATFDDSMPEEGQLVATRHREVGGAGSRIGARAVVSRWSARGPTGGRAATEARAGRIAARASAAGRAPADPTLMAQVAPGAESRPTGRQPAPVEAGTPEESLREGPRLAESHGAGVAAAATTPGRASRGATLARTGRTGEQAALGPRIAPLGPGPSRQFAMTVAAPAASGLGRGRDAGFADVQPDETFDDGPRIDEQRRGDSPTGRAVSLARGFSDTRTATPRGVRAATPQTLQPKSPSLTRTLSPSTTFLLLPGLARKGHGSGVVVGSRGGTQTALQLTTIQYGGPEADWDNHTSMMDFLAFQFRKRIGFNIETKIAVRRLDSQDIMKSPWLYMSGHNDFRFTAAQMENLRQYILAGGTLWADDSTHENDFTWDKAFRREIGRVLPSRQGFELRKITKDDDHPLFRSCFDLREGFAGYFPPPGDKYRQNFIEGIEVNGRLAVIYTRNDYGDGLEIQPDTHPLKASLSGLSPAEMQESSFLMATNIVVYALTGGAPDRGLLARAADSLRRNRAATRDQQDPYDDLQAVLFENFEGDNWITEEGWDQAGSARLGYARPPRGQEGRRLAVRYRLDGNESKCVLIRELPEERDLSGRERCYIDVESRLSGIARMSIALITMPDWKYFESRPAHVKPGSNRIFFELQAPTWKTGEPVNDGRSEYRNPIANLDAVRRFVIVLYPLQRDGTVLIDNIEFKSR